MITIKSGNIYTPREPIYRASEAFVPAQMYKSELKASGLLGRPIDRDRNSCRPEEAQRYGGDWGSPPSRWRSKEAPTEAALKRF
jgi:hypothetical protein